MRVPGLSLERMERHGRSLLAAAPHVVIVARRPDVAARPAGYGVPVSTL